jgi:hypothetical protein
MSKENRLFEVFDKVNGTNLNEFLLYGNPAFDRLDNELDDENNPTPEEHTDDNLNESSALGSPIEKFVMFSFNYPTNFISNIWGDDSMANHLQSKFDSLYDKVGSSAVISKFYSELDGVNRKKLEDWIIANYGG